MWSLEHPWWEYIFRATVIYFSVFLLLRIAGKREMGEQSAFDLILLLIISEAVSNAITDGDNSITAGLITVATFIGLNHMMDVVSFKSKKMEKLLDGEAQLLISNGKIIEKVCRKENISRSEIDAALRENNMDNLDEVRYAMLETNGNITVIPKSPQTQGTKS